jgi:hypothetical protein
MAHANQIEVERLNAEKGVLFGRSIPFRTEGVVFVSARHGVQVWYHHEGDCAACSRYAQCTALLRDFAGELKISLADTGDPTRMAEELFETLKGLL